MLLPRVLHQEPLHCRTRRNHGASPPMRRLRADADTSQRVPDYNSYTDAQYRRDAVQSMMPAHIARKRSGAPAPSIAIAANVSAARHLHRR